jgi:hypothetical protein
MDADFDGWACRSECFWCCYDYHTGEETCPIHWDLQGVGTLPDGTLDLATLLDMALIKRNSVVRAEFEGLGWSDIGNDFIYSPELAWVNDGEEVFPDDFELV